ncbi:aldose 1-epimerase family protein [Flexivirga sp. ID2601S]|uniref:Aldose 1-epimerase family protein n=1 Tax=Flexivirga aerilata TaxID=1656889 RepID=A0A849AF73_9MICO|nr:aldose 1-epimerase family protein [Flexivirga aerilata]NNG37881.1 aldose 1-epimerase family protein [Flexivirga aerilata]
MPDTQAVSPSGEQWVIERGDQRLTVVGVGGGIRSYDVAGRPALFGYPADAKADAGRGQLLVPWPNRIADGRYTFGGKDQQLPLTEPAKHNASHGLVRWATWQLVEQTDAALTVAHRLMPSPGWDGILDLAVRYELGDDGLTATPSATNVGTSPAPFGFGAHPYLTVGEGSVDELTLSLPAGQYLTVDDRLLPTGRAEVAGSDVDFRSPRQIGAAVIDTAFTGLAAGDDGRWRISVSDERWRTTLWADAADFGYAQVFTGDSLPAGRARHTGVAVEPMTCPAGAFATGEGLIVLQPGQTWSAAWGVQAGAVS